MKILRVLVPALLLLVAALGGILIAAYAIVTPQLTPFYTPPNPLAPGKPGEIIKTDPLDTHNAAVRAWRVMYHSRDLKGKDVALTGLFAAPTAPPPPNGYPLLAVAHSTEGLARQCAPSLDPWALPSFVDGYFSFPDTAVVPFVEAGYAVTATDYQGLGAPGDSAFLIGSLEAQDVLDSLRALRTFEPVQLDNQNFLWGHSQGGHAAAFTAQLSSDLAPEIKWQGIVLSAPAAQLQELVNTVLVPDKPALLTGVAMMVAGSWAQTYKLPLNVVFTDQGIQALPRVYQECLLGGIAAFNAQPPSTYYFSNPTTTSPWRETMLLNTPRAVKYPAPVFVAQGESDQIIAPRTTRAFVGQLCAAGNTVQFNLYPNTDHVNAIFASRTDVIAWLDARRRQEPAPSNCTVPPASILFDHVIFSDGSFTPDPADVLVLEARLPDFLALHQNSFSASKPPIRERLAPYKLQFRGELGSGARVIEANAMCIPEENWQTRYVLMDDGGDCFFQIKYDIDLGTFFDLSVNGEG